MIKQAAYRARFEYYYLENERPFLFSMKKFQSNPIKYDKKASYKCCNKPLIIDKASSLIRR